MLTGPERRGLMKLPPHALSDPQLRAVAPYLLADRAIIGLDRVHALIRELRRRFGWSDLEIAETTGFRPGVVHAAMQNRPPLSGVRMPR